MIRALLVDDEPPACDVLRALLRAHPEVTVVGEAGTVNEARTRLAQPDYDLVFLDIQLRGGTGFDLVPAVRPGARIIFVTAYDQHALRAFDVNALDYLMKPVAPQRLAAALTRTAEPAPAAATLPLASGDRVLLRLGGGTERFVFLDDIRLVASSENYTTVVVGSAGERLLVRRTMQAWEETLPAAQFVRVHRQTIVNLAHIRALQRSTESVSLLTLDGIAAPVHVSHRYLPALREKLPAPP